ncbi:MAG: HEAT repeat domain-containing protein [Proteobacteria bacterium]|nr:HEAT repeat domain-containing protein [Pseudomonadota bacterium]
MGLLGSFKVNKYLDVLADSESMSASEIKEAMNQIKLIGSSAIPKLMDTYVDAPKSQYIDILLTGMLNDKTLPKFVDGLTDDDKRVVMGVLRVLAKGNAYDPNRLLVYLHDPDIPRTALTQLLIIKKSALKVKPLLELLEKEDKDVRMMIFRILDTITTEAAVPELVPFASNEEPVIRAQIAKILGHCKKSTVARDALLRLIYDDNKQVRSNALESISTFEVPIATRQIVPLLKDPDLNIQAKAIDTLTKIRDPELIPQLIEILQDDAEYIRRAAVEILNLIGDESAIKDLLNAIRDKDWWVKARAADALGTIGGPKVVDAVLKLINDEDEFLRRTAVEILNSVKDERAVSYLISALKDEDWWVRERAADALGNLGDKKAVPALVEMMQTQPESTVVAIKALSQLEDPQSTKPLLEALKASGDETKIKEVIQALGKVTDKDHLPLVKEGLNDVMIGASDDLTDLANQTMATVMARFDPGAKASTASSPESSQPSANTSQPSAAPRPAAGPVIIDADSLKPGDVIDNRYKVIRMVGKGAFGVVLLVEDTMVHEEIILKFLNAHMASDESVIQRFVTELRFTRKITHPNVIRIYDFLTFGKSYAISMEYFHSHSLAYEIKNSLNKDFKRNTMILIDICKGLEVAHKLNVVHRDIKPANILVDENDIVKVVDFGLAAAASQGDASRITKSGILVGTPTYMAPEQVRGRAIDIRTDIYSLGIVMYELYTGRPPYKEQDHMATLFKHVEGNAPPAKEKNPEISDELNRIIMRAIHVNPEERYQSVDELLNDLMEYYKKEYD